MNDDKTRLVRRALDEVFAEGNLAVVDEIFHVDFVNHEAGPRTPPGPAGLKVTVEWLRRSFSDLNYQIQDEIVDRDKVVVRLRSSGRHTGEFIGFPPTGRTFSVEQIHIYRIADGKIIEHWSSRDDLSQGMQLGFIPAARRPQASPGGARIVGPGGPPAAGEPPSKPRLNASGIEVGGGKIFPAEQVVITQPQSGTFRAFSSTCTHMGCTVGEISDRAIKCPCHGSEFSIDDGSVLHGPAAEPLPQYSVQVEGDHIAIE